MRTDIQVDIKNPVTSGPAEECWIFYGYMCYIYLTENKYVHSSSKKLNHQMKNK